MSNAADDDVAVYAWDRDAVPVINDWRFANRLKNRDMLGGHVLFGRCADVRFVEFLEETFAEAVDLFEQPPASMFRIVRFNDDGVSIWHPEHLT